MRRSGEPPTFDVGPLARAVRDPETLLEAQVTASLRIETSAVDTAKLVQAQHAAHDFATFDARLAALAADSVFAELIAFAQKTSASLADAVGAPLRSKLELALTLRLARDLSPLGLGVAKLERVAVALDPATEAWMRSRRGSAARVAIAAPVPAQPDDATERAAAACARCGAQARPASRFCVACGTPMTRA